MLYFLKSNINVAVQPQYLESLKKTARCYFQNISESAVQKHLKVLTDKMFIERIGDILACYIGQI